MICHHRKSFAGINGYRSLNKDKNLKLKRLETDSELGQCLTGIGNLMNSLNKYLRIEGLVSERGK